MESHVNLDKMIRNLGDKLIKADLKRPYTLVGILNGGGYIAEGLMHYLRSRDLECYQFNIRFDKTNKKLIEGEELLKDNGSTYIFVDDAIWSSSTVTMLKDRMNEIGIKVFKVAVLLDPTHKADFSLYS